MHHRLLVCTDLDRTLIANGPQSESPHARARFEALVARPEVTLAYASGRHRELVQEAIVTHRLPVPEYVIADVGTCIYYVEPKLGWQRQLGWEREIAMDWGDKSQNELSDILCELEDLRLQEPEKQNRYKLSYYVPMTPDHDDLTALIRQRLETAGIHARLIWSIDEFRGTGLLDVVPARASKYHALKALMQAHGFGHDNTVFCGDSGNDLEVLISPIPSVLVGNAQPELKARARELADATGHGEHLYIACGVFLGMNGYYSAGILEGIAYYHPHTIEWMNVPNVYATDRSTRELS